MKPKIYAAIPALDERAAIPVLIDNLRDQDCRPFRVYICVNQPEAWWDDPPYRQLCLDNARTILYLRNLRDLPLTLIDRSSRGMGWEEGRGGVGWARKTLMDAIAGEADAHDIIVSMDADTFYPRNYLSSLASSINDHPQAAAVSVPYYHRLTGDREQDRLILRYEIYMRYYALNMWRISNPYCFTGIGSAMAFPVWAYRSVGGITPHTSGEDFYFLQKLLKFRAILYWNPVRAYPSPRFSSRVAFGTGPALIKGKDGDWSSYPLYRHEYFDEIGQTYALFPRLFEKNIETPMDGFLAAKFGDDIWQPLRKNYKTRDAFVRACKSKIDGLRILQYLRYRKQHENRSGEDALISFGKNHDHGLIPLLEPIMSDQKLTGLSVKQLDLIRDHLMKREEHYQMKDYRNKS